MPTPKDAKNVLIFLSISVLGSSIYALVNGELTGAIMCLGVATICWFLRNTVY
tara:strand:+ start:71 stop:229 length:159 start_codon:yes stop_codon:yes gene_type:complete